MLLVGLLFALTASPAAAAAEPLVIVQANLGNINGACADQAFKLCLRPVEPASQVRRLLEDLFGTLPARGRVLAMDDFDVDPYREEDASVSAFDAERRRLGLRLASGRTGDASAARAGRLDLRMVGR